MARKKMTAEQIAARVAKAKATKAAKKKAALEALGLEQYDRTRKIRKKRTLTDEQKAAAAERLAKAREARKPSENLMVDEFVRNLPDDDMFSYKNVRKWQTEAKQFLSSIKSFKDSKNWKERERYTTVEAYITNIGTYIRTGVWVDMFYGSEQQNKIKYRAAAMAYNKDGTPKRSVGVWYPDLGTEWTQEMDRDARG